MARAPDKKSNGSSPKKLVIFPILLVLLVCGAVGGYLYYEQSSKLIYVEKSEIHAPLISISPEVPGVLDRIFVREGDSVKENMILAMVNGQPIKARTDGLVVSVNNVAGQLVSAQDPIVKMIDPRELRLVGHIEENKGLSDVLPGQKAYFSADAFDGKRFFGTVEYVSPTSRQSDIVFSISNQREEKQFDVYVKFDVDAYPELKNGMSAKLWIVK